MKAIVAASLLLIVLVPMSAAQHGLIFGTEELPELPDAPNDTYYDETYLGPKDHTYIDIVAAWFAHNEERDTVTFNFKVAGARQLDPPPASWEIWCNVEGDVHIGDETTGRLRLGWEKLSNSSTLSGIAWWSDGASTGVGDFERIRHTFNAELTDPGYFRLTFARAQLLKLGDDIGPFVGSCIEFFDPTGTHAVFGNDNGDRAESEGQYSFRELRQLRSADGLVDPIEDFERRNATASPSSVRVTTSDQTPGLGLLGVLVATTLIVYVRRK